MSLLPTHATDQLKRHGTLWVPLTQTAPDAIASTFEAGFEFFRASLKDKSLNVLPEECGYRQLGIEYSQSPERPDQIESFTASARIRPATGDMPLASARTLYHRMLTTFEALEAIAEVLMIDIADTVSGGSWAEKLRGGLHRWSRLQLNYSRPAETGERYIHEAHEDGNLLTLACATAPGLEIQTTHGEFAPISPSLDHLFVMPGEIMCLLSGGAIRPLWHRVVPDSSVPERLALLLFSDLDPTLCDPWVENETNAGVDISTRVRMSVTRFGLKGFTEE
jgi:isopenicillin N synthase-like dioxygenase